MSEQLLPHKRATIVEVGPRDGFQSVECLIATDVKVALIDALYAAGIRRMEATSFVSTAALPQLADAAEIENGGAIFDHGSGGIVLLRAA